MRVSAKGQVTIPADIWARAGFGPGAEVAFEFDGEAGRLFLLPAPFDAGRGALLVAHLRERGDGSMTTDEITALTRDA
jgi:bifunctional DNA-binding transcriptional regulator/antitoxin component of YhaV-PrlF toxin-antitoxin module